MRKTVLFIITFFTFSAIKIYGEGSDSTASKSRDSAIIKISGYVDVYYAKYTDSVGVGNFQQFPSVDPRSNTFGLDHAMITAQYDGDKYRGIVSLCVGDIMQSAWASKDQNVMEAHAGIRLGKKFWLDGGFFRTHTGAEGLLPKENITSCISISTVYEPYYEAGLRLNYKPTDNWDINLFVLNGYNIYVDNNNKKSLGFLATYAFNDNTNIGYDNYIGDDTPTPADTISHVRIFQNIFFNTQIDNLKIQFGWDYFFQQNSNIIYNNQTVWAYTGVLSFKEQIRKKFAVYMRGEWFNDPEGIVAGIITDKNNYLTGYKLYGFTGGLEYKPTDNSYIRLEGRKLQMDKDQEIYYWNGEKRNYRLEMLINMGVSF